MQARQILRRIAEKGGLHGACARLYMNDTQKAILFIRECADNCHLRSAEKLWGRDLVKTILQFAGKC